VSPSIQTKEFRVNCFAFFTNLISGKIIILSSISNNFEQSDSDSGQLPALDSPNPTCNLWQARILLSITSKPMRQISQEKQ
jgi:hypothetical protein